MGRGAGESGKSQTSATARSNSVQRQLEIVVVDPTIIRGDQLPMVLRDDYDLHRNIDAREGDSVQEYHWQLVRIRVEDVLAHLYDDTQKFFTSIREQGLRHFDALEARWQLDLEESYYEADNEWIDSHDPHALERRAITETYSQQFSADPDAVTPVVVVVDDDEIDLLDGYHRLAGAMLAGVEWIKLYRFVPRNPWD
jgi:hypothetical protein